MTICSKISNFVHKKLINLGCQKAAGYPKTKFLVYVVKISQPIPVTGGRHLVDIIGDISWTKEVTSHGHFW